MYQVDNAMVSKLDTSPLYVTLNFSDGTRIPATGADITMDPIQSFTATGGTTDREAVTIGCAISSGMEIVLERSKLASMDFKGKKLTVTLGLAGEPPTIPMGDYWVKSIAKTDDTITLRCSDDIGALLDREYEPIDGFDFEASVDGKAFLAALLQRRGVGLESLSNLPDIALDIAEPLGMTDRQIVAALAGMWGKFACMNRRGDLTFRWYSDAGVDIDPSKYYDDACVTGDRFTVAYLKCYNSTLAETLVEGDPEGTSGMYFECPWCSQEHLATLWESLEGFSYNVVEDLQMLGNPLLDPGDIISLTDYEGNSYTVPVMSIYHDFDGGMITTVSAPGKSREDTQDGPVQSEVKRSIASILKRTSSVEIAIKSFNGDKIISLINLSESEAYIQASHIRLEGLTTVNSYFKVLEDGSIEALSGKIAGWTLDRYSLTKGTVGSSNFIGIYSSWQGGSYTIGSVTSANWRIMAGSSFGVTREGTLVASDAYISGTLTTESGKSKTIVTSGGVRLYYDGYLCGYVDTTYSQYTSTRGLVLRISSNAGYLAFAYPNGTDDDEQPRCAYTLNYNGGYSSVYSEVNLFHESSRYFAPVHFSSTAYFHSSAYLNGSALTTTSDRRAKNSIEALPDAYETFLDNLAPVRFKYNEGTSGRYHVGYIAQDVEAALISAGLTSQDFAGYVDIEHSGELGLAYDEFIAALHLKIRCLEARIKKLEEGSVAA